MKSRGLVVVLALVLATLATAGVFLYMQGVREDAKTGGDLVTVVVSKVDIPANTELNQLIANEQFVAQEVPADAVVDGAVTELDQLKGHKTSTVIAWWPSGIPSTPPATPPPSTREVGICSPATMNVLVLCPLS